MAEIFLSQLELQGFKSFAQKTVLDFPTRVVGIVGPNGSGKSNIIDALRWVLGEREAKQLRGGSLEHLIFSGTPKRAPVGFARVELRFNNARGEFPVDSTEVSLGRKVDRSGVSHFYLNGDEVRLKGLLPLLARARLGTRGLTIIGQGQSDMFVRSTPEARRTMIEEILGLKEYRLKKSQAERQLAAGKVNTEKVNAMLEELLPHVRFLRRQKSKWERRDEIERKLHELENRYFSFQYHTIQKSLRDHSHPTGDKEKERKAYEEEIKALEEKIRVLDTEAGQGDEMKKIREQVSALFQKRSEIEKDLARVEAVLEIQATAPKNESGKEELSHLLKEIESEIQESLGLGDIEKIKERLRKWSEKISKIFKGEKKEQSPDLLEKQKKLQSVQGQVEAEIKSLREQEEALSQKQEEMNSEFRKKVELLESKRNVLRRLDQDIQRERFEIEKIHLRLQELERDWMNAGRDEKDLSSLPQNTEHIDIHEAERKILRLRGELAAVGEIDQGLVKEAEESEERYAFLKREIEDLEKASQDLSKLVQELEKKIGKDFEKAFQRINDEFNTHFRVMFGGGKARLKLEKILPPKTENENGEETQQETTPQENNDKVPGVEIDVQLPKKKIASLSMLSGGERSLVSIAALFALIAVSPPPFLVLDEVDAALDDENARRFAELVKSFSQKTQFIIVTHNRATMEAADALYGVTMEDDGVSSLLSLRFEPRGAGSKV